MEVWLPQCNFLENIYEFSRGGIQFRQDGQGRLFVKCNFVLPCRENLRIQVQEFAVRNKKGRPRDVPKKRESLFICLGKYPVDFRAGSIFHKVSSLDGVF